MRLFPRTVTRTVIALGALAAAGCGSGGTPRSAILISVDSLPPERLGCGGDPDARTPFWDRLALRGAQFRTVLASSPRTLPSSATLLSGVHPFTHKARRDGERSFDPPGLTLAEALGRAGLRCGAVTSSEAFDPGTEIARGFEHFEGADGPDQRERSADSACDAAYRWIAGLAPDAEFFLFLQLNEPAPPHGPAPPWDRMLPDPIDAEIAATDRELTRLFLELGELGRLDRTLVVATSDHGEIEGARGTGADGFAADPADLLHDAALRVPLVIWGPLPFRGGHLREDPALLVDVLPTMLSAFRIGPDWRLPGRSLESSEPEDPVEAYAEAFAVSGGHAPARSLEVDGWKLVDGDPARLFHVAEDPAETRDLATAEPERVDALRLRIREISGEPVL